MTKTANKFLAVFLAIAMIFSFSVIGFAEEGMFNLKSGEAVAASGNFKDKYVGIKNSEEGKYILINDFYSR